MMSKRDHERLSHTERTMPTQHLYLSKSQSQNKHFLLGLSQKFSTPRIFCIPLSHVLNGDGIDGTQRELTMLIVVVVLRGRDFCELFCVDREKESSYIRKQGQTKKFGGLLYVEYSTFSTTSGLTLNCVAVQYVSKVRRRNSAGFHVEFSTFSTTSRLTLNSTE